MFLYYDSQAPNTFLAGNATSTGFNEVEQAPTMKHRRHRAR